MSIAMIERAAGALEPFLDEVAFVGGATVALCGDPRLRELVAAAGT